jgi:hypothetical protein
MRFAMAWVLLCAGAQAVAFEPRDSRGLDVAIEKIAEPLEVDGLQMAVQRATGPDVGRLAERVGERWRSAGSPLRDLSQDGWQMLSRWNGSQAELLQWRGQGRTAELLFSTFDTRQRVSRVQAPPLRLPARCTWGRQVAGLADGMRYLQRTAACRGPVGALLPELRALLTATAWQWRETSAGSFHVAQGDTRAAAGRSKAECWLVWVGEPAVREARQ